MRNLRRLLISAGFATTLISAPAAYAVTLHNDGPFGDHPARFGDLNLHHELANILGRDDVDRCETKCSGRDKGGGGGGGGGGSGGGASLGAGSFATALLGSSGSSGGSGGHHDRRFSFDLSNFLPDPDGSS